MRKNPIAETVAATLAPYLALGVVGLAVYLYWDKILLKLGAKAAGISAEKLAQDTTTITQALITPITTTKDIAQFVTGTQTPAAQPVKVNTKLIMLPYPVTHSQTEYAANIAAINKALGKLPPVA